ncbi:hypothetical protein IFM89_014618 [Coptis chinensis]|uniref:BED-type domain-containing protein n=1 Tax=Coptis chinensis TaxID=261450 RepID=A0A835M5U7_9MAGN|nr:hypothetical protein IFM89_014618 [Coptis chinensis]
MVRVKDPFWQYGEDLKGHFTCKFCKYKKSGGISRLKAHLSCLPGMYVVGCTLVPEDVQAEAILLVKEKECPNKKLKTRSSSLTGGVQHEDRLRAMVASPDWRALKQCNDVRGRQVTDIIQGIVFWYYGKEVISVLEPLIGVLRLVDGEGSTAGYLFEAMERAREEIKHRCDNDPTRYQQLLDLFDPRKDKNILHEVHAFAAFLNPKFMTIERIKYGHPLVKKGLVFAATNMISNDADGRAFSTQITEYNTKSYDIFTPIANQMETIHPQKRDTKVIDLEYLGELPEYEERGNGDDELAIPNEAIGNPNDATSNATLPTRDDIIFEELFGSSMR